MKVLINKTFEVFSSLKFTIILLLLILVYLAVSTFIPQEAEYVKYLFENRPSLFLLLKITGLLNPYHNFVVVFWLFLFTFNLIACTLNRLPLIQKRLQRNLSKEYLPLDSLVELDIEIKADSNIIEKRILELYGKNVLKKQIDGINYLIIRRGIYSALNFLFVHISILIIIFGITISAIFGYEGFIKLTEGKPENLFYREVLKGNYIKMPLPFELKLNKFSNIVLNTGQSIDYISDITVIDKGKEFNTRLRVNEPLEYKSILFVQSSFERNTELSQFMLSIEDSDGKRGLTLRFGEEAEIHNKRFVIEDYFENVHNMGPAIKIKYGDEIIISLYKKPEIQNEESDIRVYIEKIDIPYNSILRITYDPGTRFVFIGSTLFLLSLLLVIFYRFKMIVVRLGERNKIFYIGKNLESEIKDIASKLNANGEHI